MPSHGAIADDEEHALLGASGSAPRRFSNRITRSLGIIQCLFGIVCLVQAVLFPTLPKIAGNLENEGSANCDCSSSHGTLHSVSFNVISPRSGDGKCIFSVVMTTVACMLTLNGIIGAMSSLKIKPKEILNIANFFLGVPNTILSSCGIMLCSYALYLDGATFDGGDSEKKNSAWFISGIQASCYIESITSLFVVLNCLFQMRSNSCACKCSFMGTDCTCGCDDENRTVSESHENDRFNGEHSQHEEDEERISSPFHGRDDTNGDMKHENGGFRRKLRQCASENNGNEEYMDMNHGPCAPQGNEDGAYVAMERKNVGCTLEKDRNRTYVNLKHGDGGLRRLSKECISEGPGDPHNGSQQHLEPRLYRPLNDTQLVSSDQSQQINILQRRPGETNKSSSNCYEEVVDVKNDCT